MGESLLELATTINLFLVMSTICTLAKRASSTTLSQLAAILVPPVLHHMQESIIRAHAIVDFHQRGLVLL